MAAPEQVGGIGVEGVQVDHRKGRIELVGGDIEPALERGLEKVHPNRGGYPLEDQLQSRPEHGT